MVRQTNKDNPAGLPAGTPAPAHRWVVFNSEFYWSTPAHPPSSKSLPCIKPRPRSGSDSRAGESSAPATATPTTAAFFTQHNRTTRRTECLKLLIPKLNLPPAHCCQKLDLEHACGFALSHPIFSRILSWRRFSFVSAVL